MSTVLEKRPTVPADADEERAPLVSVVIPCLNEAENIEECVTGALQALAQMDVQGEVVVADNDSEDDSARLAERAGARVVTERRRGYGSAYLAGFAASRGRYIVMADADLTYDFNEIPRFVAALEDGAELVMGDRMDNIQPGAMPWLHRYIGNPILSGLLNLFFRTGVKDAHCGMRALRRDVLARLDLRTTGMEFASEMVIRASKEKLRIAEFPIEYHPRGGESKLSSFRDGWRHLRFLLVHSPNHLFIFPGALLAGLGTLIVVFVGAGLDFFGRAWGLHALIGGALLMIVGTQVLALGLCAHAYGTYFMGEKDPWFDRMRARFRLEHGLLLGGAFALIGLAMGTAIAASWISHGFGSLSYEHLAVIAASLVIVGIQIFFSSFLLSILVCAAASVPPLRRLPAVVFAGDARVWRAAAVVALPLLLVVAFYLLLPRAYYTGTNNVEVYTYVAEARPGERVCVRGLRIPAGTGRLRLQLASRTRLRPALKLALTVGGMHPLRIDSELDPVTVGATRISKPVFALPALSALRGERAASLCLTATDLVNWGGTPLLTVPEPSPPTVGGRPISARIAVWYLPPRGAQRSYLARTGEILSRAALFRPDPVGPWLYVLILLILLPGLALASVRCIALAADARSHLGRRRMGTALLAIAALNFACWALITPPFQAPDEVDHFAYTQSLVERGQAPSRNPASPLPRWSSAEALLLEDMSFLTDHQKGDTRPPWTAAQQARYRAQAASVDPSSSNGGGNETAATHGVIYYAALAPAYLLASGSPLSQLTLMRLTSALIGALTVLFTFLLARELAPGRPWLAVLAALLVAYQPMYGFISGAVNNDVGVNAGAAGVELLLILIMRRGLTVSLGLLAGGGLLALPIVKGTAYSLYPVAGIALLATAWRHHRRSDAAGWAALAVTALAVRELSQRLGGVFRSSATAATVGTVEAASATGAVNGALEHPFGYLSYVWQIFLPRLSFMSPHYELIGYPAFVIFDKRGWGAFGWYDVFFPAWVYSVLLVAMLAVPVLGLVAARREWSFVRRNLPEALVLLLIPIAVVAGFEAAYFTNGIRNFVPEFGRYTFPAIAPLAVLVVASLHAFPRRWVLRVGVGLVVSMLALSFAAQLVTLTGFYA